MFDNFTINIDICGQSKFSTMLYFQILISNVRNKLHIVNYTALDVNRLIGSYKSEVMHNSTIDENDIDNKIIITQEMPKSINAVLSYAQGLSKNDFLFIIGGERLCTYSKTTPVFQTNIGDLKTRFHFCEEENWVQLCKEVDCLYGEVQNNLQGIVLNINTDKNSRQIILKALDQSKNMSITSVEQNDQDEAYENLQKEIFNKMTNTSLMEILEIIKSYKSELDNITVNYLTAMAYLKHGDISKTITILETDYNELRNEEKLVLSDLLLSTGHKERAKEILYLLFEDDKYQNGLIPAILKLQEENDNAEQKKWIDLALDIDPLNPAILEFYGNWLSRNNDYVGAVKIFRELRDVMKSPYYELVARMNELLYSMYPKTKDAIAYINEFIEKNPEYTNEARFRLANYFTSHRQSFVPAYAVLKGTVIDIEEPKVQEIEKLKLDILSDVVKASKALKPYSNSKYNNADLLNYERSKVLLECIPILATSSNGYMFWRSFLENSQLESTWKKSIFERLKEALVEISIVKYSTELDKSQIRIIGSNYENGPKHYQGIILLRRVKSGEFSIEDNFNSLDEFLQGNLKYGEVYGDNEYKLWCRYYLSVILSIKGEHQLANNYALSILEYYPRLVGTHKSLCVYLGVMAWGNSQYRIGRQVEGIACVLSVFHLAQKLIEFYPFVEEGVTIITRFLADNHELFLESDKKIFNKFYDDLKDHNESLKDMWHLINGSSSSLISELETVIECTDKDVNWAGKLVNLISAYMQNGMEDKGIELIKNYGDEAIRKLSNRMDIRYKVILNWAQIYFYHVGDISGFQKALELLEQAIIDIEKRRMVYHKAERASIGESSDEIYRFYLQICSLLFGIKETDEISRKEYQSKIENILPRISPRSVIEQKNSIEDEITSEIEELKSRSKYLTEEYNNLHKENSTNLELLSSKAKEIEVITEELKKKHPHYKPLPIYEGIKFNDIQKSLEEEEVFYQYFITPMSVVTLLITKDIISLKPKLIEPVEMSVQGISNVFGLLIQQINANDDIDYVNLELSRVVVDDLIEYLSSHKATKLYYMQDFKMGLFPLAITYIDNMRLIDNVKSIINIIDYSIIGKRHNTGNDYYTIGNRLFGHEEKIEKWLRAKKDKSFIVMDNQSDDVDNLLDFNIRNDVKTLIIYGHGVPDPNASLIDGAQGIAGQKNLIRLNDIIDNMGDIKNFILISCRGGSPSSNSPENSSGSWSDIFGRFNGNIISCKWDVPTDSTIYILNEMLNFIKQDNMSFDEALISAQKKARMKYKHPVYWAGIEFWRN